MPLQRLRVAEPDTTCKCCGGPSRLCGVVDFSVGGADRIAGRKLDPYAGVPIYYHGCERCRFTFTRAFDDWSPADFAEHVYNDDYPRQDPDFRGDRARANAELIASRFPEMAGQASLDFGSGLGQLERELAARGFGQVTSYDPYAGGTQAASAPASSRNVLAFEVFEHHPEPHALIETLLSYLDGDGAILLSTLLVPEGPIDGGIGMWWYCMPRNGHISLYSGTALGTLAALHGLKAVSFDEGLHLLYRGAPPIWAARFFGVELAS